MQSKPTIRDSAVERSAHNSRKSSALSAQNTRHCGPKAGGGWGGMEAPIRSKQCTHPKIQGQALKPAAPYPLNHILGPLGMQQGSKGETKWH